MRLEIGQKFAPPEQAFAACDGRVRVLTDQRERLRIEEVYFHPHHVMLVQKMRDATIAFGLEVEVCIKQQIHTVAGALPNGVQLFVDSAQQASVGVQFRPSFGNCEAGHEQARAIFLKKVDVHLESRKALFAHLCAKLSHAFQRG